MTILPTPPDYTDKDFEAINQRLNLLLQAAFPTWTDFQRASFGNILKECYAFSMDVLTYYQDQQARETRWGTAILRESIIQLARLIGYTLDGASAATVDVVFSMASPRSTDVDIPVGTTIKTVGSNPIKFQTLAATAITAGNTSSTPVSAQHSEIQQDTDTAAGEANEEFQLTSRPFLDDSDTLRIGGNTWTRVDNFLDSLPTDKHYIILVNAEDYAKIRVGDGINGLVPTLGDAVVIDYKIGGGTSGNIEANKLVQVEGSFSDQTGASVSLTCDNALAASGGTARETVAQARDQAPRSLRVLNRAVARTDFEDLAVQVSGVARALMLTRADWTGVAEDGYGYLWIVPDGGGQPSGALVTAVESYINNNFPPPLNFGWEVRTPTVYNTINIKAYVYLSPDATESSVELAVLAALQSFFSPANDDYTPNTQIDFGYNYKDNAGDPDPKVALSTIYNLIHDIVGIRRLGTPADGEGLELNGSEDDVDLVENEFPEAGTLELWNGDTNTIFPGHPISI